jgi:hypothetical protein
MIPINVIFVIEKIPDGLATFSAEATDPKQRDRVHQTTA